MPAPTISRKIELYLTELIEKNATVPGYKLPSESMLARKFSVSHIPIRNAYKNLIDRGLVISYQGKGYFIKEGAAVAGDSPYKNIVFLTPSIKALLVRRMIEGIQSYCEKQRLNLSVLISEQDPVKESRFLRELIQSPCNGVIVFPIDKEFYNEELLKLSLSRFPVVIIDRNLRGVNFSYVAMDNYNAMLDAVKFLHDKRYKNIVYLTPPHYLATSVEERILGYRTAIQKHYPDSKNEFLLEIKPDDMPAIKQSIIQYLKKYPDTEILIATGAQVIPALQAAAELGIPVPEKLRLMLIDNELSETEKDKVQPYIIEVNGYEMGYRACEALYNQMYGDLRLLTEKMPVRIVDCAQPHGGGN